MKYLMENETAFDTQSLGFPSIQGCHAIVYQNATGIYGFHVAGGSGDDKWPHNAKHFKNFIQGHGVLGNVPTRLYGVSFIGNNQRGYSVSDWNKKLYRAKWKAELLEFASELNYTGKISGYDLFKSLADNSASAYVEFVVNGSKCDVSVERWTGPPVPPRATNATPNEHMGRGGSGYSPTLIHLPSVVTNVTTTSLIKISKEQIRS